MIEESEKEYSVDGKLKILWQGMLPYLKKIDADRVYIVDGRERLGKSTFTIQQACYIEPGLMDSPEKLVSRIAFTPEEFLELVRNVKNGVIIFDEAFRGLSSRGAMSKTNKIIIQALMEMGQNNNVVFIVLPSFFMLDTYPAMHRSDIFFHIYKDKKGGRCFVAYNHEDKNKIYQMGLKKGYNIAFYSKFRGRFYGKFPAGQKFKEAYLEKKAKALKNMFKESAKEADNFYLVAEIMRKDNIPWDVIGKYFRISGENARKRWQRRDKIYNSNALLSENLPKEEAIEEE